MLTLLSTYSPAVLLLLMLNCIFDKVGLLNSRTCLSNIAKEATCVTRKRKVKGIQNT